MAWFSETRKKLFTQASQPWIFWLDADEVITPELDKELKGINFESSTCEGFEVNRKVFFENQWITHGEWFPDWNIRIFRFNSWKMESRDVHEGIILKGTSKRLNGLLEHHSYRDWNDRNLRMEKYSELWAQMKLKRRSQNLYGRGDFACNLAFLSKLHHKVGFLDGILGLKVSISIAKEVNLKYKKLYQLQS